MKDCAHPIEQRWQYPQMWFCCACWRYFMGDKRYTPATDIYGRVS